MYAFNYDFYIIFSFSLVFNANFNVKIGIHTKCMLLALLSNYNLIKNLTTTESFLGKKCVTAKNYAVRVSCTLCWSGYQRTKVYVHFSIMKTMLFY